MLELNSWGCKSTMEDRKPKVLVIGITGRMKSGKNQVAEYIKECIEERAKKPGSTLRRFKVKIYAFADPLKECLINTFGIHRSAVYTQEGKASMSYRWGMTYREMLQKFGTDAVRKNLHDDAWIFAMDNYISNITEDTILIIPDVRFKNEARLCDNYGWVVNVVRPSIVTKWMKFKEALHLVHPSEQPLTSRYYDYEIVNDKDLKSLKIKVGLFVSWLGR